VALVLLLVGVIHAAGAAPVLPEGVDVDISGTPAGRDLPSGFLGISTEYSALEPYAGGDPAAIDPVFVHLVANLAPGQAPTLRIGGDSADWTWWPVPGVTQPPGVNYRLKPRWLHVARALGQTLRATYILGLNLEANSTAVAGTEAQQLLSGLGSRSVSAFELGNEPELYGKFPWYHDAAGHGVPGRPASYSFSDFLSDFARIAAALPTHPLAGPTIGGPGWAPHLDSFLAGNQEVRSVALHGYPLQLCHTARGSPRYPTVAHLLSNTASTTFAQGFAPAIAVAHAHRLPLRIDELSTVSCGAAPAVSQTFASALWALDVLFELDRAGVDGVQMHTFPGAGYALFALRHAAGAWTGTVAPEYYGLLAFVAVARPGSRLLSVTGVAQSGLKVWATEGRDGHVRVAVINKDPARSVTVRLAIPGVGGSGTLQRLTAPGASARSGVTLGGQSVGATSGELTGSAVHDTVSAVDGRYAVRVPAASAALLDLAR
jgi:Glycosyl hydrolase family 79 C-terminal beta domain